MAVTLTPVDVWRVKAALRSVIASLGPATPEGEAMQSTLDLLDAVMPARRSAEIMPAPVPPKPRKRRAAARPVKPVLDAVARGRLAARSQAVLELAARGLSNPEIAATLGVSPETVKTHLKTTCDQLRARNRVHAVAIAIRTGLITLEEQ